MFLLIFFSDSYNADQINLFKEIFYIIYFKKRQLFTFHCKSIYHFSIIRDNFVALHISNSLCIFAILSIIVLNFTTPKVQKSFYDNILLKCKKISKNFAPFFSILVVWKFNTFLISMFCTVIFIMF